MKKKKANLPKKNAGRNLSARLKDLANQKPPKKIVNKINDGKDKGFNLLYYVYDCSPQLKKFKSVKDLEAFVEKFTKKYPDSSAGVTGNWIDFWVTGITGKITLNSNLSTEVK